MCVCVVHRGSNPSAAEVLKEEEMQEDAEEDSGAHCGANDHEALTVFIVAMVLAVDVRQIYHQYFEETAQKNMPLAKAMKKHARVHCIAGIGAASREVMAAACVLGCDVVVCDDNTNTTSLQKDFTQWVQEQHVSSDVASLSRQKLRGNDEEASDNEPIDEDDMESFAIKEPEEKSSDEDDTPLARLQKKPKEARHTGGGKVAQAERIAAQDKKDKLLRRNEKEALLKGIAAKDMLLQRHAAATAAAKKRKKTTVGKNSSSEEEWEEEDPAATKQKKTKAPKPRRSDGDSSDGDNSDEAFQSIKPKYPKKTAHKAG